MDNWVKINEKIDEIYYISSNIKLEECTISLLDGLGGLLLFVYEFEKTHPTYNFEKTSLILNYILQKLQQEPQDCSYSNGLSGLNIIIKNIVFDNFLDMKTNKLLKLLTINIDKTCLSFLLNQHFSGTSDFLHGEIGILWGILAHSKHKKEKQFQQYLSNFIIQNNIHKQGFFYAPPMVASSENTISLGLSHGIPALLIMLAHGLPTTKWAKNVISTVKNFIDSSKNIHCAYLFPSFIFPNSKQEYSRLAWCYGDLGVAVAIWQAGKNYANKNWQNQAIDILVKSSQRKDLQENDIKDAGLCHGTAGIAHIYNRMYRETNHYLFKETANYWIEQTLKMAYHTDGLAGYKAMGSINDYFFLEGVSGIGLALMSHINTENPIWDKTLLLS